MILFSKLTKWSEYLALKFEKVNDSSMVINQNDLRDVFEDLKQESYPFAAVVIPSSKGDARDEDNYGEINLILFFILMPTEEMGDYASRMSYMNMMMDVTAQIKQDLRDQREDEEAPFHDIFDKIDLNSFHTDPERNFMGHDGWSVSFKVKTMGY